MIPTVAAGPSATVKPVAETDRELIRRVTGREPEAFEELYRRYSPAAYGLALRVLRQPFLAQEVVHDAFAAVWNAPDAFDPSRGSFRSFLLSLVHHRAVDAVRREERLRERERRANPPKVQAEDVEEVVVEEAGLADRRRAIRDALAALSPEQREAIELMYFRGWTQTRIARETGVPLGTVKSRVFAAMRRLRQVLG
jgi:RNA polymerase sigma factor (sigma-70 family)